LNKGAIANTQAMDFFVALAETLRNEEPG
jgi:hypothetical protein